MNVLGVVTARGGSKGVPRKNIRPLGGKPLLAWTLEAAKGARRLTRCVVSTEDEEIALVARAHGGDAPFLRPAELATDAAKTLPVLVHALEAVEKADGKRYDWVLTLQPTSPFRTSADIDAILDLAERENPKSAVSVVDASDRHPFKCRKADGKRLVDLFPGHAPAEGSPRQALPQVYRTNGALFLTRRDVLLAGSLYGGDTAYYVMPPERSLDIDSELDFEFAEFLARRGESRG